MGGKPRREHFYWGELIPRGTKQRFWFGNWRRNRLDEMVQTWGRERYYISCNYSCTLSILVKILLKNLCIQYASKLIIKKENSNQNVKVQKMALLWSWLFTKCCLKILHDFNPVHDGPFFSGLLRGWGTKMVPLPKICLKYHTVMTLSKVIPYLKKIQKIYKSCDVPLEFCWHRHFFTQNQQILVFREIQIQIEF